MSGKVLFDGVGPKTQSVESVKAMIEFFDGEPCQKMPRIVVLANGWQLTRSSKGDCYYMTSARGCSCSGFYYRQSCRHVKALRDQEQQEQLQVEKLSPGQELTRHIQQMEAEGVA